MHISNFWNELRTETSSFLLKELPSLTSVRPSLQPSYTATFTQKSAYGQ